MTGRALRLEDRGVKALQPQDRSPNEREVHQPAAFASSDFAAVRSLWVAERLQAPRRGARECQGDALAGRGVQPVLRRFAHQLGPVAVSKNESGVGRKDIE